MPDSAYESILSGAGVAHTSAEEALGRVVRMEVTEIRAALGALAAGGFDQLVDMFATDTGEAIELTYHLRAFAGFETLFVKCTVPYDGELASVWEIYPAALFPEREAAELLGMTLSGHPNPKRLLTVEGSEPMLRKSVAVRGAEEVQFS
jgi:NADH:ubiquinone oxidoreductase subunit C